ncbi:hypothetical protein [Psychroserpens sp. SPM9]|uniref:HD domain-containing protein n=1 Tax=Psychroserpens sp. SPM9 TaxID=2975598 RepID=UPI0021A50349|nr:hypothetical protein [Psychroserpens sp. SPM9]MDG5490894.1 hypothetical protein [Psychroserpens sp. SPM9]
MTTWLQQEWTLLTSKYSTDAGLVSRYWKEIKTYYTSKNRHYHSLTHIYEMLKQAETIKADIVNYDSFRFAIWYHDIIYKATKKNNELKSAEFAQKRLKSFDFDEKHLKKVEILIKSTQNHVNILGENKDNAYLLDIDLSILGSAWNTYKTYIENIRKEYAIYPDFIYNSGRKKAMQHFLERESIYLTDVYQKQFETQARENIKREISLL